MAAYHFEVEKHLVWQQCIEEQPSSYLEKSTQTKEEEASNSSNVANRTEKKTEQKERVTAVWYLSVSKEAHLSMLAHSRK